MTSCKDILVSAAQHTPAAMPGTLRADSEGPSLGLHTLLLHHLLLQPQLSHSHTKQTKIFMLQQKTPSWCSVFALHHLERVSCRDVRSKRKHLLQLCRVRMLLFTHPSEDIHSTQPLQHSQAAASAIPRRPQLGGNSYTHTHHRAVSDWPASPDKLPRPR